MASSSNRRRLNRSSESSARLASPTFEYDLATNLQLFNFLDSVAQVDASASSSSVPGSAVSFSEDADHELNRMLSLHREVSTTSSAAEYHAAAQIRGDESFTKIGAGACGAVFAQDGRSLVVKLAKAEDQVLWNDYIMHASIAKHFSTYDIDEVKIPACYYFVPKHDPQYFDQRPGLLEAAEQVCNLPTSALVTERILALPQATRTLLIEKYCAPRNKQKAMADPANKDCLVRTYLGSSQGKSRRMFFSLRNFKMHLNQMVEIQLDVKEMARRMAIAMAIMHWAAKTDARDVEFVLGSSTKKFTLVLDPDELRRLEPLTYTGPSSRRDEDFFRRTTELWVLDFNQVRPITLDETGVAQAVEAARINDPYLPKPLQESLIEKQLWNAFVVSYLEASDTILQDGEYGQDALGLPRKFLLGLIESQRKKQQVAVAATGFQDH